MIFDGIKSARMSDIITSQQKRFDLKKSNFFGSKNDLKIQQSIHLL